MSVAAAGITIAHLGKRFGGRHVVRDVSFAVRPGAVTGFLGPNGAGKTTTLRMLLGLVTPSEGHALIGGVRYAELPRPGRTVGALLDATGFHPGRTGRDHLRTYAPAAGVDDVRVGEVLDLVGLGDAGRRRVRGYSLGMRQRLGIATALLADPPVLVCDEPANGLDPDGMRWLRELLRSQAGQGKTVLVSSHLLTEMQHTIDAAVILHHGELVYAGRLDQTAQATVRVRCADPARLASALTAADVSDVVVEPEPPDALLVRGLSAERIGAIAMAAAVAVSELRTTGTSLEELFFGLTESRDESRDENGARR